VENTSDPGFAMRVKNSSLKRHKCRAPIVFLNQPWLSSARTDKEFAKTRHAVKMRADLCETNCAEKLHL
jgi:hypothetical protein